MPKALQKTLLLLMVANCVIRFVGLENAPPGFFYDEARAAAHAVCIQETRRDAVGEWMPIYSPVEGSIFATRRGGLYPATWTYSGAAWIQLFGKSRASFRALAAFYSVLSILFLYLLVKLLVNSQVALVAAFVLAYMPAHFHLSRLAWENAMIPIFLIGGIFFLFRSTRTTGKSAELLQLLLSALFFNLAILSYPSPRIQIPLILPVLLWMRNRLRKWNAKTVVIFGCGLILFAVPFLKGILDGYLLARFEAVSIFDPEWLTHYFPRRFLTGPTVTGFQYWIAASVAFTWKFLLHFSPWFLFFHGDVNIRHSPQFVGELGFLEAVAILFALWKLFWGKKNESLNLSGHRATKWFCAFAIVAGILPSALTKESPHALRCIGVFPFVAIWTALQLQDLFDTIPEYKRTSLVAVGAGTAVFCAYFLLTYFRFYPDLARPHFTTQLSDQAEQAAKSNNWESFVRQAPYQRDRLARAYYAMSLGDRSCREVRLWLP